MTQPATGTASALDLAERFTTAYNAKDLDGLRALLAPDIQMRHHNRGVDIAGADAVIALVESFEGAFPDRRFHSVRRSFELDGRAVVEHTWEANATADVPGFAKEGETARIEICTVLTARNGQIAEYDDYG